MLALLFVIREDMKCSIDYFLKLSMFAFELLVLTGRIKYQRRVKRRGRVHVMPFIYSLWNWRIFLYSIQVFKIFLLIWLSKLLYLNGFNCLRHPILIWVITGIFLLFYWAIMRCRLFLCIFRYSLLNFLLFYLIWGHFGASNTCFS